MNQLLKTYNETLYSICEFFGLKHYFGFPQIDDRTNQYWMVLGDKVVYHTTPFCIADFNKEHWRYAEESIYEDRLNEPLIRRGKYTAIMVKTDGAGLFLAIFDNSKEI